MDDSITEEELKKILGDKIILEDENKLPPATDGKKLAKLLRKIVNEGGLTSFPKDIDGIIEWQREQRKDRKLPFRDE
ncbi:MAG TPA: hypothetical protein VEC12_01845 [Bacteroidia bacterium]|nr:hypothetical protein [Bacteroidia bacterium]